MNEQIALGDAVAQLDDLRCRAVEANAPVSLCTKDDRLAMLERDRAIWAHGLVREFDEGAVVEHVAVLIDLDEGCPFVVRCAFQCRDEVVHIDVERTGDERRPCS